jgi:hypothetical protein
VASVATAGAGLVTDEHAVGAERVPGQRCGGRTIQPPSVLGTRVPKLGMRSVWHLCVPVRR